MPVRRVNGKLILLPTGRIEGEPIARSGTFGGYATFQPAIPLSSIAAAQGLRIDSAGRFVPQDQADGVSGDGGASGAHPPPAQNGKPGFWSQFGTELYNTLPFGVKLAFGASGASTRAATGARK